MTLFFFFSSTSLLLPTHLPPPSCTHAQSCNPMDFSPPDSCPWIFPGKNTGVGCHFLLHDYDTFDCHSLLSLIFLQTEASLPFLRASFAFSSQSIPLVLLLKRQVPLPSGILLYCAVNHVMISLKTVSFSAAGAVGIILFCPPPYLHHLSSAWGYCW